MENTNLELAIWRRECDWLIVPEKENRKDGQEEIVEEIKTKFSRIDGKHKF